MTAKQKLAAAAAKPTVDLGAPDGAPETPATPLVVVPKGKRAKPGKSDGGEPPASEEPPKGWKIKESTRPVLEIAQEWVRYGEDGASISLVPGMPLEEFLPLLDHLQRIHEHSGFFIGDAMIAADREHKEKLVWAMAATGRSLSTLQSYIATARALPPEVRRPALGWTYHQRVASIANNQEAGGLKKVKELLKLAEKGGEDGQPMTVKEFERKVVEAKPAKTPKAGAKKRGPKTKASKKAAAAASKPARELTEAETAALDACHEIINEVADVCTRLNDALKATPEPGKDGMQLLEVIRHADYATKKGFTSALPGDTLEELRKAWQYISDHQGNPK